MTQIKDQAICIRRQNYSETSQIVTLFGYNQGKIRAIAKGSRRAKSKFQGGIDLLTAGAIIFKPAYTDSGLATLIEFDLIKTFATLRQHLIPINCAQYAAELVSAFTEDLDPHEDLYLAFDALLTDLPQSQQPELTLLQFEITLLCEVGLGPTWHHCCLCGQELPPTAKLYFSSLNGGMLCRECEPAVIEKRFLSRQALQLIQHPDNPHSFPYPVILEAHELLAYHQRELLGKEPPTMRFVNQLLRKQGAKK